MFPGGCQAQPARFLAVPHLHNELDQLCALLPRAEKKVFLEENREPRKKQQTAHCPAPSLVQAPHTPPKATSQMANIRRTALEFAAARVPSTAYYRARNAPTCPHGACTPRLTLRPAQRIDSGSGTPGDFPSSDSRTYEQNKDVFCTG